MQNRTRRPGHVSTPPRATHTPLTYMFTEHLCLPSRKRELLIEKETVTGACLELPKGRGEQLRAPGKERWEGRRGVGVLSETRGLAQAFQSRRPRPQAGKPPAARVLFVNLWVPVNSRARRQPTPGKCVGPGETEPQAISLERDRWAPIQPLQVTMPALLRRPRPSFMKPGAQLF